MDTGIYEKVGTKTIRIDSQKGEEQQAVVDGKWRFELWQNESRNRNI